MDDPGEAGPPTRRDNVFLVLAGIFITHALLGEVTGGKLFSFAWWPLLSIGVIPWPVVFITTDIVNEYYGAAAVRRLTLLTVVLIAYTFVLLYVCMQVPAAAISPVDDAAFAMVFGQSQRIIVGSIIAFAVSQLIDAAVFVQLRRWTAGRWLWLRAVGSTLISQLIDTFVINTLAFHVLEEPEHRLSWIDVVSLSIGNYSYKFLVALATLPVIYLGHAVLEGYLRGERRSPR